MCSEFVIECTQSFTKNTSKKRLHDTTSILHRKQADD